MSKFQRGDKVRLRGDPNEYLDHHNFKKGEAYTVAVVWHADIPDGECISVCEHEEGPYSKHFDLAKTTNEERVEQRRRELNV